MLPLALCLALTVAPEPPHVDGNEARPPEGERSVSALADAPAAAFEVVLSYERSAGSRDGRPERAQIGFLVAPNGIGVTAASAFQLADEAKARCPGIRGECSVRILGCDADADMLLVQLSPRAKQPEEPFGPFLVLASEHEGDLVGLWSLVPGTGAAELVSNEILLEGEPVRLKATRASARLGGAPILSPTGGLVGVWAWTPPGEAPRTFRAARIAGLLERFGESEPRSVAQSRDAIGSSPGRAVPDLRWGRSDKGDAQRRINQLPGDCICRKCDGSGQFNDSETRNVNGKHQRVDHWITCPACDGDRLNDGETLWKYVRVVAEKLAALPENDRYDLLADLEESVAAIVAVNHAYFVGKLNDSASEVLHPRRMVPGNGVVMVLPFGEWPEERSAWFEDDTRACRSNDFGPLLVRAARARSVIREGQAALVLGVAGGSVDAGDEAWKVVQNAAVVPISADNTKLGK